MNDVQGVLMDQRPPPGFRGIFKLSRSRGRGQTSRQKKEKNPSTPINQSNSLQHPNVVVPYGILRSVESPSPTYQPSMWNLSSLAAFADPESSFQKLYHESIVSTSTVGPTPSILEQEGPKWEPSSQNSTSTFSSWSPPEASVPVVWEDPKENQGFSIQSHTFPLPQSSSSPSLSVLPDSSTQTLNYFELLQQPNEKQRKSYGKENRYILPNPLTIVPRNSKDSATVLEGNIVASLISEHGDGDKEVELGGNKAKIFDIEKKAQFSLKILDTSDGVRFHLKFTIYFKLNGTAFHQTIVSQSFKVFSNKKSHLLEKPRPSGVIPKIGFNSIENEVWIKGRGFLDRGSVTITFGGKEAKITSSEDNLIVCMSPIRADLIVDTTVSVIVSNFNKNSTAKSERVLSFTYQIQDPEIQEQVYKRAKKDTTGE